jgi:hypothetical protein
MKVYRLDPQDYRDPRWADASVVCEAVFTAAMTAWDARKVVALKTATDACARNQSPWLDERMTRCMWDKAKGYIPKGAVETGTGRVLA